MVEYAKPWLSIDQQVDKLESRGVEVNNRRTAVKLLSAIGYYRLTGCLYPFRESELYDDDDDDDNDEKSRTQILGNYRPGTSIALAAEIIDFDRSLRMLVMDGVERIEVALRMRVGYTLGRISPFAHLNEETYVSSFTQRLLDENSGATTSRYGTWWNAVDVRRSNSDEAFVAHFRSKYDDQMPIWALTEVLELGHLAKLYRGLISSLANEIANEFGAPSKKVMTSWLASINYVRNVAAHQARLYNRKLVAAPQRPKVGRVPLLDHLREGTTPEDVFGVYNSLAVIAYLLRSIDESSGWPEQFGRLMADFPAAPGFSESALGMPANWRTLELWAEC